MQATIHKSRAVRVLAENNLPYGPQSCIIRQGEPQIFQSETKRNFDQTKTKRNLAKLSIYETKRNETWENNFGLRNKTKYTINMDSVCTVYIFHCLVYMYTHTPLSGRPVNEKDKTWDHIPHVSYIRSTETGQKVHIHQILVGMLDIRGSGVW